MSLAPILLRLTVTALSLALALSTVTPADAFVFAPEFVEQQVYLTCTEPTKVTNLNRYYYEADNPSWSTTPPTGTFAGGDGCTAIDTVVYDPPPGGSFNIAAQGGFVGNLDTIVFDLYAAQPVEEVAVRSFWLDVVIDGETVTARSSVFPLVEPVSESLTRFRFAVGQLGLIDDFEGPGSAYHDISVGVTGNNFVPKAWILGAGDAPSGLTFNADVVGLPSPEDWVRMPIFPYVEDPCGDTESHVNGEPVEHPVHEGTDLSEVHYQTTYYADRARTVSGLDLLFDTCGPFGADGVADTVRFTWTADPDPACDVVQGYVEVQASPQNYLPATAYYGQDCVEEVDGSATVTERFREALPWRAVESGIDWRIRLRRHDLSEQAAATLTRGSLVGGPTALGSAFAGEAVEFGTSQDGLEAQVSLIDRTAAGPDLLLGTD